MNEKELRDASTCGICGKKIGSSGVPMFFRVSIQRFALNLAACQRQHGLELMLGAQLGQIMGPGESLADPLAEAHEFTICNDCCAHQTCVLALEECVDPPAAVPAQVEPEGSSPNIV
jgi:hypothetical protein